MNTTSVDAYLQDGCGRCDHYRMPTCKVHRWTTSLEDLRRMVLATGLIEEMKWGSPCYTQGGKNVVMLGAFKESCVLTFFGGVELVDDEGMLEAPGPNSRSARLIRFRSIEDVTTRRLSIQRILDQAIALDRTGSQGPNETTPLDVPVELERRMVADPDLQRAFDALTPGRQRSHILHISGAKQAETRERRVERSLPAILSGRGFNER